MSKKPLGKDKYGIQKVMRFSDYFGDSLGQFALNVINGLVGQLTYFYTDKVGMAAGAVATAFLISKIFDAFTDLIMGYIIDHTKPGKEKYRPWLLKAGIPAGVFIALLFTVPKGSIGLQLAYMMVTNILLTAVFYTAICIPYTSLQIVRTNSQEERGKMGIWRSASGYVSGMIIAVAIVPVTNMLGGTQSAWIKVGIIFGLCVILAMLICYLISRETPVERGKESFAEKIQAKTEGGEAEENIPFTEAVSKLFHNKYWVIILIVNLLSNVIYGLANSSGTYYCKWIYGDDNLVGILGAVGMIPTLLGFILVGPMIKKLGVVKTLKVTFMLGVIANALRIFNPYHFVFNTVLGCFNTFANIPMMCLLGVMSSMAIDYNEYKYGIRMVASATSAASFGMKIANGIGASLVGWCLAIAGYDAELAAATTATKYAIFTFSIYVPLLMFIVMYILTRKIDLEERMAEIKQTVEERKAAKK